MAKATKKKGTISGTEVGAKERGIHLGRLDQLTEESVGKALGLEPGWRKKGPFAKTAESA